MYTYRAALAGFQMIATGSRLMVSQQTARYLAASKRDTGR
jgi:hypothetical protein